MTASSRASCQSPPPVRAVRFLIGCRAKEVIFSNLCNKAENILISSDCCTHSAEWMTGREGGGAEGGWRGGEVGGALGMGGRRRGQGSEERGERADGLGLLGAEGLDDRLDLSGRRWGQGRGEDAR